MMCAAATMLRRDNFRDAGQCQSIKAKRDFDGDQQGPDALEGLQQRTKHQDHDWLHEAACAWTTEELFPDSEQPVSAPYESCEEIALEKRKVDSNLLVAGHTLSNVRSAPSEQSSYNVSVIVTLAVPVA
jgi:hypothetical protein